ncbi:hypothetical protein BN1723_013171, partial [Verticillium longisporum]
MSVREGLIISQPPTYDCFNDRTDIEPNSDIAGLGILAGFLGPAFLAVIIITVHYFVAFDLNKSPDHGMVGSDQDCEMQRLRPSRVQSSRQSVASSTNAVTELNSEETIQRRNEVDSSSSSQSRSLGLQEETTIPHRGRDLPDHQTRCNCEAECDGKWSPNPIDQLIFGSELGRWLFPKRSSLQDPDPFARDMRKAFDNVRAANKLIPPCRNLTTICTVHPSLLRRAYATLGGPSGISAYHWQIAVLLAWLANITHLVGLTFLRDYLRERPLHRNVRLVPTTILLVLLLVALFPTGWFNWSYLDSHRGANPASPSSYARCFFNVQTATQRALDSSDMRVGFPEGSGSSMVFSILFLSMSFGIRLIKLSRRASNFFRNVVRRYARRKLRQLALDTTARFKPTSPRLNFVRQYFFVNFIIAILMTARIYADVATSTFSEVLFAWVAVLWVTIRIFATRASVHLDENDFTFGQIVAVLLLIGPTITAALTAWPLLTRRRTPQDHWRTRLAPFSWLKEGFVAWVTSFTTPQYRFDANDPINHITCHHKKPLQLANKSMSYQAPWTDFIVIAVMGNLISCSIGIIQYTTLFMDRTPNGLGFTKVVDLFYYCFIIFLYMVPLNLFGVATVLGEDVAGSDPNGEPNYMPSVSFSRLRPGL